MTINQAIRDWIDPRIVSEAELQQALYSAESKILSMKDETTRFTYYTVLTNTSPQYTVVNVPSGFEWIPVSGYMYLINGAAAGTSQVIMVFTDRPIQYQTQVVPLKWYYFTKSLAKQNDVVRAVFTQGAAYGSRNDRAEPLILLEYVPLPTRPLVGNDALVIEHALTQALDVAYITMEFEVRRLK